MTLSTMWAYNSMIKCIANSRVSFSPSAWQRFSLSSRSSISIASLHKFSLSAQRPVVLTEVFCSSVQRQIFKRDFHLSKCFRSDSSSNFAKDVMLYKYENVRLYKMITLFGITNFLMFMTISLNIYTVMTKFATEGGEGSSEFDSDANESSSVSSYSPTLINPETNVTTTSSSVEDSSAAESSKEPISTSYLLTALCGVTFLLGYVMLAGTWLYCNNAVRYLVLRKNGKQVTVVSHGTFGYNRYRTCDLDSVNIRGDRTVSSALLMKVKGKRIPYLLDIKGTYTNPELFDTTVGVPRNLK